MTELRTCKKCNEEKLLTEYCKCSKTAWRRSCKSCCNKFNKKWKRENKDLNTLQQNIGYFVTSF